MDHYTRCLCLHTSTYAQIADSPIYLDDNLIATVLEVMINFIDFPPETIEEILLFCDPVDVASFAQTCRFARSLVYQATDEYLWRVLYLSQPFDDPRKCTSLIGIPRSYIDWRGELQRIMRAKAVIKQPTICRPGEKSTVISTLLDMVCNVPPMPTGASCQPSRNLLWVIAVLSEGDFLDHALCDNLSPEGQQQLARLHTYFGLTNGDIEPSKRVKSRAFVYNMRKYTADNDYGPFMMDGSGRVNWLHVQALHHVVSMHFEWQIPNQDDFLNLPMSLPAIRPVVPKGLDCDREIDWAGVEGLWICSFCFCDHRELLVYNNSATEDSDPNPFLFEDPDFSEVFRSVEINISIIDMAHDHRYPTRPRIRFVAKIGESSLMDGWVQMTPDDQVKWSFASGGQGESVWSCQGIQVGGIGSAYGILGSWTTIFHADEDPVGPFWLRKYSVGT